ncbi:transposase family protein [Pseudonocardia alaniniphila]|uniref:transposase family protein n=1 Tax=Pseudonocardia alaniniphila TaxID=75291 RepID=UPI003CD05EF0
MTDPRKSRGVRHRLVTVLSAAVYAVLGGARSYVVIAEWAHDLPVSVRLRLGIGRRRRASRRSGGSCSAWTPTSWTPRSAAGSPDELSPLPAPGRPAPGRGRRSRWTARPPAEPAKPIRSRRGSGGPGPSPAGAREDARGCVSAWVTRADACLLSDRCGDEPGPPTTSLNLAVCRYRSSPLPYAPSTWLRKARAVLSGPIARTAGRAPPGGRTCNSSPFPQTGPWGPRRCDAATFRR